MGVPVPVTVASSWRDRAAALWEQLKAARSAGFWREELELVEALDAELELGADELRSAGRLEEEI